MNDFVIHVDIRRALPPFTADASNGELIDSRDYHFATERSNLLEILNDNYVTTVSQAAAMHAELSAARSAILKDLTSWLPLYTCAELFAFDDVNEEPVKLCAVMGEIAAEE